MMGEPLCRATELALLDALLDQPAGRLRVALLVGEPGIGKSTLWLGGVDAARRRGYTVLSSRPAEIERRLPDLVLGDLFRDVSPRRLEPLPRPQRRALDAALLMGDRADAAIDPRALGVAVATVLRSMADEGPLLIAIDDDQWMDASSASALAFALRRLADGPVRLLLARRRHGRPFVALERSVDSAAIDRLELGPLSLGATQLLLRERLAVILPRPTLRELHRVSGGNPFHALELGRARAADASRDLALPISGGTVDDLIRGRIDRLDVATRRALLLVAANGRTPSVLLGTLDIPGPVIEEAIAAGFVERSGDDVGLAHPLLAAAVYEGAGGARRRAAHRELAAAIEDAVLRGRHVALGAAEPSATVAAGLEEAARTASVRGQSVAAADLAEHAVRLTPPVDVDERHRRIIVAARARLDAGDGPRARQLLAGLLDASPSGARRAEALILCAGLETAAAAVAMLDEALRAAGTEPRLRAVIHATLGAAGRVVRGRAWAERHVEASLRLATALADDRLHARALSAMALLRFERAESGAIDLACEAYELAVRAHDEVGREAAALAVGHLLMWSGETDDARSWLSERSQEWRDRDEMMQAECLWYLAMVELRAGRWPEATALAEEATEIRARYGLELPPDHLPPALVALHRGGFDLARRHSERALSLADRMLLPSHLAILATIDAWTGDPARAVAGFERAEAAADAREADDPAMRDWRPEHCEALLRVGRVDDAVRLVEPWESVAIRLGRNRELAGATRVRGLIAAAQGDLGRAVRLLDDAATRHAGSGDRFGWGRARLASGIVHRRLRRKRLARTAFDEAATAFEGLGAASWVIETRAELGRLGGRQRMEGMSPSERRVAELVAEGRTNRDIAAALFVSERTVASHLTHVYAKLGLRSRTELARFLAQGASNIPTS